MKNLAEAECGVWLDTVQLKAKAKQKRHARPISKLLNPFSGGEGYNLAVALNFTQTKMEMPKTKQSSISTFFTPQRRVLNKMSTSEVLNTDTTSSSSSASAAAPTPAASPIKQDMDEAPSSSPCTSSTAPTPAASGTKRKREIDLDPDLDLWEQESESATEPEAAVWQEQEESTHTPSQNSEKEHFKEINSPQSKRRVTAASSLLGESLLQAWSQDPLFTFSQCSEDEFSLNSQKNTTTKNFRNSEQSFLNSLQCEEAFGIQMYKEGRTSTQKSFKHFDSSQFDDEKENISLWSSKSPSKRSAVSHIEPLSNHKWTEPKTASPRKLPPMHPRKKADEEEGRVSQFKWTKPSFSPLKKQDSPPSCGAIEDESLAMLFTQDSEGFRVIAHRGLQPRSPLKDQSNIKAKTVRTHKSFKHPVEEDEEDEILFTQDSQGNMVIKH